MIKLDGHTVDITMFPDKTSQVWKIPEYMLNTARINIYWYFEHEGEIVHLAQIKDLLDSRQIECDLSIDYLPYARQDKLVLH